MKFVKNNTALIFLLIFALVCLCFSAGHYSNLYTDIGREMYYPVEILNGKVLYKNLFCIYAPFSYLFNAFLFKIFGTKLSVLYTSGIFCGLLIVLFTYKSAKRFLSPLAAFSVGFFVCATGCLSTRIFNFTLPYSYAMLYGTSAFLISLCFLIKYIDTNAPKNLAIAAFFAGIAAANKYDFILYLIPFFIVSYRTKRVKYAIKPFLTAFLIPFLVLFFQGVSFDDLINAVENIRKFTSSETLKTFYMTQGVYYTSKLWGVWLHDFICFLPPFLLTFAGVILFEKKHAFLGSFFVLAGILTVFACANISCYLFITFLVFLLFILFFKKNTCAENIFIISALLTALKSLWGLSHGNYGLYYTGVIFISFLIMAKQKFVINTIAFMILGAGMNFFISNLISIKENNIKIITDKGFIKTDFEQAKLTNELLDFVNSIQEETPYVMIFPEGLSINFLSHKKTLTDGQYNSLIPLYIQESDEEKITEHYRQNPPEYLILSSIQNKDYGHGGICDTFAGKFCKFIYQNYLPFEKIEGKTQTFFIFKLK